MIGWCFWRTPPASVLPPLAKRGTTWDDGFLLNLLSCLITHFLLSCLFLLSENRKGKPLWSWSRVQTRSVLRLRFPATRQTQTQQSDSQEFKSFIVLAFSITNRRRCHQTLLDGPKTSGLMSSDPSACRPGEAWRPPQACKPHHEGSMGACINQANRVGHVTTNQLLLSGPVLMLPTLQHSSLLPDQLC